MNNPATWQTARLGGICRIEIGGTPARNVPEFWARNRSGYPWVSISDLDGGLVTETNERITSDGIEHSNVKLVPTGTVMMSFKLTLGRMGVAGIDLFTNEAIASFFPDYSQLTPRWLYYILPSVARNGDADQAIKGQTLNKDKLENLLIPLPLIAEQRRIADILDTADAAIQQTEALIAKLKLMREGLLHDLLTRGLDERGELRDPVAHPEQFKETALGVLPREWEVVGLQSFVRADDGIKPGPFGSNLTKAMYTSDGFRVYGQEQVIAGDLSTGNYYIPFAKYQELQVFAVQENDLLLSLVGTAGKVLIVTQPFELGIINPRLMRLRPLLAVTNIHYLRYLLTSSIVLAQLARIAQGGTMDVLSSAVLRRLLLPQPPLAEQILVSNVVSECNARVRAEEAYRDKLKLLKQGLMDDLLTGRVRVPVDEGVTA